MLLQGLKPRRPNPCQLQLGHLWAASGLGNRLMAVTSSLLLCMRMGECVLCSGFWG